MSSHEKLLCLIDCNEIARCLINNEFPDDGTRESACLALEFRLRVRKDILKSGLYKQAKQFIEKGVILRKQREEDIILCKVLDEYEGAMAAITSELTSSKEIEDDNSTHGESASQNLGAKEYQLQPRRGCKRQSTVENKVSRVKVTPKTMPSKRVRLNNENPAPSTSTGTRNWKPLNEDGIEHHDEIIANNTSIQRTEIQSKTTSKESSKTVNQGNFEDEEIYKHIEIQNNTLEYFDKFNYKNRKVQVKLLPPPEGQDVLQWIYDSIKEVCDKVKDGVLPADLVCLTITNNLSPDRPIYINARASRSLTTDVVLDSFQKVGQSNQDFLVNDALMFELHHVEMPVGKGSSMKNSAKLAQLDRNSWVKQKRSMILVENDKNDCLALALIVAMAQHSDDPKIRDHVRKCQRGKYATEMIQKLLGGSGVNLDNGGGYEEIDQFQNYLKDYKIIVYNSRDGKKVYYDDEIHDQRKKLYLYLEDGHYDVILNLVGAFCYRQFCDKCHQGSRDANYIHTCKKACVRCRASPQCLIENNLRVMCDKCNRKFFGTKCYENHLQRNAKGMTTCDFLKQCKTCDTTYRVDEKNNRQHECGEIFCKHCNDYKQYDHLCYMKQSELPKYYDSTYKKTKLVFFDLECTQNKEKIGSANTFLHEPILCVSQQCCFHCSNYRDIEKNKPDYKCNHCGLRQKIYEGNNIITDFLDDLNKVDKKFDKTIVLSHYGSGYDTNFILRAVLEGGKKFQDPVLILNGSKIISLKVNNLTFLDSLNFMPLPLSKLPASFGLKELKKGYFPHMFTSTENMSYQGPIPLLKYYSPDNMSIEGRKKFLEWYNSEKASNKQYIFRQELIDYCCSDVDILRQSCVRFRELMWNTGNVDCFMEATTIASTCNLVFRRNYLKENVIGLEPKRGYRLRDNQSKEAIEWLVWQEHLLGRPIQHAARGPEKKLLGRRVDGYYVDDKGQHVILQYHGCYMHGCKKCYKDSEVALPDDPNSNMQYRWESTESTKRKFVNAGFQYVEKWSCDFQEEKKRNPFIQQVIKESELCSERVKLNSRDAFRGGRTNCFKLYYKVQPGEKIAYYDFTSLYPFINKYAKYPVVHPTLYFGTECPELKDLEGLICATVLPPKQLYLPVLPYAINGKLMFFLCKKCAEETSQVSCNHTDKVRQFTSTFVSDELKKAVEKGYKIIKMHEAWHYGTIVYDRTTKSGGLFTAYINKYLKIKQESSGWPPECITEEEKLQYIENYEKYEGIKLDYQKISLNPGLRFLAKLMLNTLWGKYAQRVNLKKHEIFESAQELYKKISEPGIIINSFKVVTADKLLMMYEYESEAIRPGSTVNLPIVCYTTAQARLRLYDVMEKVGDCLLYGDTDSCQFIEREGTKIDLPIGNYLGDLTSELDCYGKDAYISEFVSGGPKNYAYSVFIPTKNETKTIMKVKGITLNYNSDKVVNMNTLKEMVLNGLTEVTVNNPCQIRRTPQHELITTSIDKKYRVVYTKRRRIPGTYDTLPFGYVDNL